jgi:hypothetical protein
MRLIDLRKKREGNCVIKSRRIGEEASRSGGRAHTEAAQRVIETQPQDTRDGIQDVEGFVAEWFCLTVVSPDMSFLL